MDNSSKTNTQETPLNIESERTTGPRSNTNSNKNPRARTRRNRSKPQNQLPDGDNDNGVNQTSQPRPPRRRNPAPTPDNAVSTSSVTNDSAHRQQPLPSQSRRRNPPNATKTSTTDPNASTSQNSRRSRFGAGLTQPEPSESTPSHNTSRKNKGRALPSSQEGDDLISILIRKLTSAPYHDCPICFSPIRPDQAIWSCSPSSPLIQDGQNKPSQYCWTSFHVKCIHSWADKSVKEVAEAWRARGEPDKKGDWRCPGCQAKRDIVPSGYWCFCHSTSEPKQVRLATPHSCGNSCSRVRESGCGHPCPLQCHPGPCPPCQITTRPECYCPLKKVLAFRCGIDANAGRDLSCGNVCGRTLGCKKHTCERVCHSGECDKCEVKEMARCWCGKEEKEIGCGEGEERQCFVEGQPPWMGRFSCDNLCERLFDCGIHKCDKPCHPPSPTPDICPRSPSKVTHCPCGNNTIAPNSFVDQSLYTFLSRDNCTSPIPTCDSVCSKPNPACSHPCKAKCHTGPCPPCSVSILRPCRCGSMTKSLACHEAYKPSSSSSTSSTDPSIEENEILCDRPCAALRACGRHQCRRVCCPLAALANNTSGKKGRRRVVDDGLVVVAVGEEHGGLHECDLVCGKMLSCGNHKCEERDHKGPCGRCMRTSFEELVCTCGLTVYDPPIPCGTVMQCTYPCLRPAPPCGHPTNPHTCHDDTVSCPPCPFLATKLCACGKKLVPNVRCSLETDKVSCGTVCGKLMGCGFHHCERLCHNDECGNCSAPCGKTRKSCLPDTHPCTRTCHAPSLCPETEPCESLITLTCPCNRIRQSVLCGRTNTSQRITTATTAAAAAGSSSSSNSTASSFSSSGHHHHSHAATPKCNNECQTAKRNARLADALGISQDVRDNSNNKNVVYSDELVGFARGNLKFLGLVEKTFAEFITSEKRTNVLPHMPPDRRKFVHDLASVYRMDAQMVDQEPHRSVQVIRRIDTRIPTPLLSTFITPAAPALGKLADFRSVKATQSSWRPTAAVPPVTTKSWNTTTTTSQTQGSSSNAPTQRGWTSVVTSGSSTSSIANNTSTHSSSSVFAPKPNTTTSSEVVVPVSSHSSTLGVAGSSLSRTVSPAQFATTSEPVPEDWEDDV